jgi:hypothetical protein
MLNNSLNQIFELFSSPISFSKQLRSPSFSFYLTKGLVTNEISLAVFAMISFLLPFLHFSTLPTLLSLTIVETIEEAPHGDI